VDRRKFVSTVAASLVTGPALAQTQPGARIYRVGFLLGATRESVASLFQALQEGMREHGYVDGRNVIFEQRYAGGRVERLPELAAELVRLRVDVIVTGSTVHVQAASRATKTIPIVTVFTADPVSSGFVSTLARPGGNITGLSADSSPELWAKYLAFLKETVPRLSRVGVIGQAVARAGFDELRSASRRMNLILEVADLQSPDDFDSAFAGLVSKRIGALVVVIGPLTYQLRERISEAALKARLPAITNASEFPAAGLLMSYGPNLLGLYRHAASYVDKILRGASPANMPVEQPTKFDLIINLKTAKALDITVPQSLRLLAETIIQ
jgi:putative ABC transport system substrate-binding protein